MPLDHLDLPGLVGFVLTLTLAYTVATSIRWAPKDD